MTAKDMYEQSKNIMNDSLQRVRQANDQIESASEEISFLLSQLQKLKATTGEDIARGQKAYGDGEPCDSDVAKTGLGFAAGYWYSKAKESELHTEMLTKQAEKIKELSETLSLFLTEITDCKGIKNSLCRSHDMHMDKNSLCRIGRLRESAKTVLKRNYVN